MASLTDAADHQLGAAEGAAALRQSSRDGGGVGQGKMRVGVFVGRLQVNVLFALRDILIAFQQYHGHGTFSLNEWS